MIGDAAQRSNGARDDWPFARHLWLFPATYFAHLGEESFAGETFPVWLARLRGVNLPWRSFVAINAGAFVIVCLASLAAARIPRMRLLAGVLGTIVCANAMLHLGASVLTHSYSPGLVTGTLLWLPLGGTALLAVARHLGGRALLRGVAAGLVAHSVVSALAFYAGR